MTPYQKQLTRMTKRMADDMKIRNLAQATIDAYTYHVGKFAEFFGKPLQLKTRRFGGWSNTRRDRYLERCAIMLEATAVPLSADTMEFGRFTLLEQKTGEEREKGEHCPTCGGTMRLIDRREKPSWLKIMNFPCRPKWYGLDSFWR